MSQGRQSPNGDTKTAKRNSGLFSFLRWFKSSSSRESVNSDTLNSASGSCESINSIQSSGTVASFSYVPPSAYKAGTPKIISQGPETDTYKARLKQRDKRREKDKNTTLRKKYNLFFNRDTLLKQQKEKDEDNSKSLPLMTRTNNMQDERACHRRTASESSKLKKAGAYCHVKGKRKAPPPPGENQDTASIRRKKRLAPQPPPVLITQDKIFNSLANIEYADAVIYNDSLKLDHGILKPAKEDETKSVDENTTTSARSSYVEAPVSPRPWYKRNVNKEKKLEQIDVQFTRNSAIDLQEDDKRKSGLSFLTNISELDREASRIIKEQKSNDEIPPFMRPKQDEQLNMDTLQPKRRSARDLIAKFNAITNVTKVTVNSALFFGGGNKDAGKRDYFGRQISKSEDVKKDNKNMNPLMKSESANVIKTIIKKESTPKPERKNWNCPKCSIENEYWRIICHVCSTIKPYFDELSVTSKEKKNDEKKTTMVTHDYEGYNNKYVEKVNVLQDVKNKEVNPTERTFERSRTQIGFSILTNKYKSEDKSNRQPENVNKKEEREKLKKMLIEMKNSLPKKKNNAARQSHRTSIIQENPENLIEKQAENLQPDIKKMTDNLQTEIKKITKQEVVTTPIRITPEKRIFQRNESYKKSEERETNIAILNKTTENIKKTIENVKMLSANANLTDVKRGAVKSCIIEKKVDKNDILDDKLKIQTKLPENKSKLAENETKFAENDIKFAENTTKFAENATKFAENESKLAENEIKLAENEARLTKNESIIENQPKNVELIIATTETVYENIKVKKTETPKPIKVSSSAQTSGVIKKTITETKPNFELLKPKDFDDIYSDKTGKYSDRVYANLAEKDELSLFFNVPKKFNDIKLATGNSINTDTIEINRMLRRLENAIAKGEMSDAAIYARELAQLKVNCSVVRQKKDNINDSGLTVDMYVEDKISHRGPFPINVKLTQKVYELKLQIEKDFEIPRNVQRWILGKELAVDDNATLKDHHVTVEGCPIFLYLVAPTNNEIKIDQEDVLKKKNLQKSCGEETGAKRKTVENGIHNAETVRIEDKKEEPKVVSAIYKSDIQIAEKQTPSSSSFVATTEEPKPTVLNKIHQESSTSNSAIVTTTISLIGAIVPPQSNKKAPLTKQEGLDDDDDDYYDSNTLKAQTNKEWSCKTCTLINPPNRNVCDICGTVRKIEVQSITTTAKRVKRKAPLKPRDKNDQHYLQLVNLDNEELVENLEPFECLVCFTEIEPGKGVTLRECIHSFCKECLANTIEFSEEAEIKCPYRDEQYSCDIALQDREIKALVSKEIYEQHLAKSVAQAENKIDKSFHCKTPDCKGWCIFEDNVNEFKCPVCKRTNCLTCQAIHIGLNCKQYQEGMNQQSETDEDAKRTKEMLDEMVKKGEALICPVCKVVLMKKWGCDWVRCSMCKTEICWVTRGPRWGPAGKGDTSGGCKCGVNGVKCHPQCNYCH